MLRLSGQSQTFKSLNNKHTSLPDLRINLHVNAPRKSQLAVKANILGHVLLNLWVPALVDEDNNFIPKIKYDARHQSGFSLCLANSNAYRFDVIDPERIITYFKNGRAQNLGALTMVNLILSGYAHPSKLLVTISQKTDEIFFTQNLQRFWSNFFHGDECLSIASLHSKQEKLNFFISADPWWQAVSPEPEKIFILESYLVALRVLLTPWFMVEKIAMAILVDEDRNEVQKFMLHLRQRIIWVVENLESFFSSEEMVAFWHFMRENGRVELERYLVDLEQYFESTPIIDGALVADSKRSVIGLGMYFNIHNLETYLCNEQLVTYDNCIKKTCINYMLEMMKKHSEDMVLDSQHRYWELANDLLKIGVMCIVVPKCEPSFVYLFIKAIQFQKNNIVSYFIITNELFKNYATSNCHKDDPDRAYLENRSPFFVSLYCQNTAAQQMLKRRMARLNTVDLAMLKQLLLIYVQDKQQAPFAFILNGCPEIIRDGFDAQLLQACAENAQDFLPVVEDAIKGEKRLSNLRLTRRQSFCKFSF